MEQLKQSALMPGAIELKGDEDGDDPTAIVTKALDELKGSVDERIKAIEEKSGDASKITDRLDKLEFRLNRPGTGGDRKDGPNVEQKAFVGFIRRGADGIPDEDRKALRVADSQAGGYLAPEAFETEILKELVEISPIRSAATVRQTSSASVVQPKRTGRITAKWVGETEARPGTEPAYGQIETPVHEMACWIDVSNQLLEDAAVNIEAELTGEFAEEFGRLEGEAFVLGDGVKKPVGLMVDASVPVVPNGNATAIQGDALISLMYDLPAMYRNRGTWLMTGTTIAAIRKLKDGQGNYLWQPAYQVGQPETLLGRPVVEAVDMDDIAADTFPIAYGDIAATYRIYDRVGLSVLRDPFTQATNGITRFHSRRRVGAAVVRAEAVRKLKMAVS
ncbi:hypothetical protein LCGC14_0187970 [marine sediment metagenome]|uniref:Phage major capsid protein n=2 Tax=root TaxID=1 RepID=A0A9C9NIV3_9HYPH|nr:phage major capsid protein [Aurantimonas coralicida]